MAKPELCSAGFSLRCNLVSRWPYQCPRFFYAFQKKIPQQKYLQLACVSLPELISGAREYDGLICLGLIHPQGQMWPASLGPHRALMTEWFSREKSWYEIIKGAMSKAKIICVYHIRVCLHYSRQLLKKPDQTAVVPQTMPGFPVASLRWVFCNFSTIFKCARFVGFAHQP